MAVPFYIPDDDESNVPNSESSVTINSPTRSIPIPNNSNLPTPQQSTIDSEVLVQAFYEALCRCSQGSPMSPQMSMPSSPMNHGQFFFPLHMMPSPSTSAFSSPRHSFRVPRRRLNSHGSYTQDSDDAGDEDEIQQDLIDWENHYQHREQLQEFTGRVPQPKKKKSKSEESNSKKSNEKPKNDKSKITNFVINALQYVIDSLR
ncbi:CLUMA_CG011236, isoform A [Clunio marinus]|uniref:CLUMA_CG011236, isoform A n=1 Tax=Clunio marinus TaxID=568069 RepID=A0A1J1IC51_9DIPT|nr:CLUMA_CG011236, isoform A [Clunio marinus]